MGVPKFFRYISERYPCLSEVVKEYQLPEFDNLYLDMNGIIHICSHPNDTDPHFRITEEKIFRDIFHYIETLFRMIQPQRLFFMAVDGVAPRAKMNQQRGRRFRSAKEAETAEARARSKGEILPTAERFDSNCITPGTEFMTRLHAQLKYFVTLKVSSDKLWQKVKVVLSGHEVPGEGEHKIMDYIRYMKSQPDYDPNTRHCLYGLDADLIMLGLCTHEPHFSLLREEVKYGKKNNQKRIPTPEETTFFLLHLSLMREYLDLEFQQLKTSLPFPYDLENIIDDWVLMGFLVGNDFIPHLPDLHINKGALPILYRTYAEVLPTLGGYINEGGNLRLDRFQKYMEKLAAFDLEQFKETNADLKYLEAKTGRKYGRHSDKNDEEEQTSPPKNKALAALIASTEELLEGSEEDDEDADSDDEDEDGISFAEFCAHKNNYYMEKLEYDKVTPEVLRSQAECYVRAIQWNLNYYYNGCCSWSWFYPHHYAPYVSDVRNFSNLMLEYDLGQPFLPFQQLLAVLPSASKKLLPEAYHDLMVNDNSPIIQFYPTEFKTDLNGKRQDWEAVVLIPFIEQKSLLQAMETKEEQLTEEERSRNKHGPMQVYTYTPERLGPYMSPAYFPALANNHAKEENLYREQLYVDQSQLIKGLCPGVRLEVYFLGFPTLKHIPFTAGLRKAKVKVFESPSQGENMILTITPQGHPNVSDVASQLLGKNIYVNWPHMFEARVVAVSSEEIRFSLRAEDNSIQSEKMTTKMVSRWSMTKQGIEDRYMDRMGIDVGPTEILVYACTLEDRKFIMTDDGKICYEKQWSKLPIAYALQTTRTNIAVQEPVPPVSLNLEKLFPADTIVFTLYPHQYGSKATVVEVCKNHRVKVTPEAEPEISLDSIKQNMAYISSPYKSGNEIAKKVGLTSHLVSRITGTIFILAAEQQEAENKPFKLNIGLNLKFNKRNEEVCGFTRRDKHSGYWLYSSKAEQEIREYRERFPEVFDHLGSSAGSDDIYGNQLYPEDTQEKLAELGAWLKERGSCGAERQTCGAEVLEEAVVMAIESYIDSLDTTNCEKPLTFNAKPSLLYLPKPKLGQAPDPRASHRLFDRVVNVRESHTVPLGARGTIIGIHDSEKGPEAMYDIVFDKTFTGGLKIRCSPHRGYRLPAQAFINRSYGTASESARSSGKPTAVVEPSVCLSHFTKYDLVGDYTKGVVLGTEEEAGGWNNNNGHSSAFASWRNKSNYDIGGSPNQKMRGEQDHRSPRHQYNAQWGMGVEELEFRSPKNQQFNHPSQDLNLRPDQPRSRQFNPSNPVPVQQQSAPQQLSNEYFAMFKQLQKAGNNANYPKPVGSVEDSSEALKKILRINNDNKNSIPPAAHKPPHQHQQPTKPQQQYQQPFKPQQQHQPPTKSQQPTMPQQHHQQPIMPQQQHQQPIMPQQQHQQPIMPQQQHQLTTMPQQQHIQPHHNNTTSHIKQLFSIHQSKGMRLPKYLYADAQDGAIICTVICNNGQEFQGAPSYTNEQAAESAAKIALKCMALDEQRGRGGMMVGLGPGVAPFPHGHNRHPPSSFPPNSRLAMGWTHGLEPAKPSTLPQPPTNWYQTGQSFMPDWRAGAGASVVQPQQPYFPPPAQQFQHGHGHQLPISPMTMHQVGSRQPFIPLQAQCRVRQQPQNIAPHMQAHTDTQDSYASTQLSRAPQQPQNTTKEPAGPRGSRSESRASGRNSTRPPRSRLAANFSQPLTFDPQSDNPQGTP